ncbi:MAG: hypothetical protein J6I64_07560 [Lachnospiraceae bacterium]|nr:hypothetical protein [Lachnospiraceae bacterium]
MKKRIFTIVTISALALTAAGCSCSQPAQVTPSGTEAVQTTEAPAPETTAAPETEAPTTAAPETTAAVKDVTISVETYKDEASVKITYPVLSGLKDESLQKKWNDLFFADAHSDAEYLVAGDTFTSTWEVASGTARVISLVKTTLLTDADGKTERTLVAYNIDSTNGQMKRLTQLSDVNAIAEDLAKAAAALEKGQANNAYILYDAEGKDITAEISLTDLLAHYKSLITGPAAGDVQAGLIRLLSYVDYTDNGQIAGYSFWRDGVLRLVFPYDAAISDYIVIEVKDAHRTSTSK